MTDSSVEKVMAVREPLTDKERSDVQWAYHKGTEARKQVIQELFGRHITHASCLAMVDKYVRIAELEDKAKAVAKPTEEEFWDWLCCAAFHGHIWSSDAKGKVRNWIEIHCQVMGESIWEEEDPKLFEKHKAPDPVPTTFWIEAHKHFLLAVKHTAKLIGPALLIVLGFFLERITASLFP